MQKKKKVVLKGKDKSVKKANGNGHPKPIVKKTAKKLAPKKQITIEKDKVEKIKENKDALMQATQKTNKKPENDSYVPSIDTKSLSADQLENYKKWLKLHKQHGEEKALDYQMTQEFEIKTPLKHKIHGWGIVIQRRDNYIDVLFETGMKTLVCNYKSA